MCCLFVPASVCVVCRHLRACLCVPVCMTRVVYMRLLHLPSRGEFIMNDNVYEYDILSLCNECSVCQRERAGESVQLHALACWCVARGGKALYIQMTCDHVT